MLCYVVGAAHRIIESIHLLLKPCVVMTVERVTSTAVVRLHSSTSNQPPRRPQRSYPPLHP